MESLVKILFLLTSALFYDRSFIPPTLRPSLEEQRRAVMNAQRNISWYERLIGLPILPLWVRITYWAFMITELFSIFGQAYINVLPGGLGERHVAGGLTTSFLFGTSLIITGAIIRFFCFRELGRQFTFAVCLRDDHILVTSGPYAVVRHPSYTGGNMTFLGATLVVLSDGSWWLGGGYTTAWGRFLTFNFAGSLILYVPAFLRGAKEDAYLRKWFGRDWERFAHNVPYRYIPGIC
ncbi:hypothetical protein B0H11DRAFT_2152294 [Mycena galericulata]|nr:hypothetical protein B0H11DRAFT_2152294 [Mycena galericulata]